MSAERAQVGTELTNRHGDFADRLGGVDVQGHVTAAARSGDGGHVLNATGLVVDELDGDEHGLPTNGRRHPLGIDAPVALAVDISHGGAARREGAGRIEHGPVLDLRGHEMRMLATRSSQHTFECEVVGLGCAGGEHDLARRRADTRGHGRTSGLDGRARAPPRRVQRRGIRHIARERLAHDLHDGRVDG